MAPSSSTSPLLEHARGVLSGIGDAKTFDHGEGHHAVRRRVLGASDVFYMGSTGRQRVGDEGTMAAPRDGLAHIRATVRSEASARSFASPVSKSSVSM